MNHRTFAYRLSSGRYLSIVALALLGLVFGVGRVWMMGADADGADSIELFAADRSDATNAAAPLPAGTLRAYHVDVVATTATGQDSGLPEIVASNLDDDVAGIVASDLSEDIVRVVASDLFDD